MGYTVLARRYRSQGFDDLIGQEPIATTLKNAVATGRIHHGYLFTGTRGVGKTSMARILAKALNCLASDRPTDKPCGQCDCCQAIAAGQDMDVLEIDAASNTGVDNIRELRSSANYRPARSRYKVYIIDEVHMLSIGAFNALLKTLEEPPEHVKFILATTEPQKVPPTIQSRCQRFDFRPIPADLIARQLDHIVRTEGAQADAALTRRIAWLANGSMRDALSLLDQLLSLGHRKLTADLLEQLLPRPDQQSLARLVDCLAANDAAGALKAVDKALASGYSSEQLVVSLNEYLRQLMLLSVCGRDTDLADPTCPARQRMLEQFDRFDAATYVYMITVLEELGRNVRFSASGRALIDAAIVRLAQANRFCSIESLLARLGQTDRTIESPARQPAETAAQATPITPEPSHTRPQPRRKLDPPDRTVSLPSSTASEPARLDRRDLQAALSQPLVRKALEIFDGTLVQVRRATAYGRVQNPS